MPLGWIRCEGFQHVPPSQGQLLKDTTRSCCEFRCTIQENVSLHSFQSATRFRFFRYPNFVRHQTVPFNLTSGSTSHFGTQFWDPDLSGWRWNHSRLLASEGGRTGVKQWNQSGRKLVQWKWWCLMVDFLRMFSVNISNVQSFRECLLIVTRIDLIPHFAGL